MAPPAPQPSNNMGYIVIGLAVVGVLVYYFMRHGTDGKGGPAAPPSPPPKPPAMKGDVVIEMPGAKWSEKAANLAHGACKINADDASCACGESEACVKPAGGSTFTSGGCREVTVTIPKGMKMSAYGMAGGGFSCVSDMPSKSGCYAKGGANGLKACSGKKEGGCDSWKYRDVDLCGFNDKPISGQFSACAYHFSACDNGDCKTDKACDYKNYHVVQN